VSCTISQKRLKEIMAFWLEHGDAETCLNYDITPETLSRYKRKAKNKFEFIDTDKISLLDKIASQYSKKELQAIAEGGRIIPGLKKVPIVNFDGDEFTFGLISDTHIGSVYYPEEYLTAALNECEDQSCQFIAHCGDVTEGMSRREGHIYELTHLGYERQKEYAVDQLSQWDGQWYFISGNHDRWYLKSNGANVVQDIADALPEAEFLGHDNGDIPIRLKGNSIVIRLWHGEDGNSYAISYRIQKVVESIPGGEKPNVLCLGHVHKAAFLPLRNIHCFGAGSIQKQSAWMKAKRIEAHVCFWIITVWINHMGVAKVHQRFEPFY